MKKLSQKEKEDIGLKFANEVHDLIGRYMKEAVGNIRMDDFFVIICAGLDTEKQLMKQHFIDRAEQLAKKKQKEADESQQGK